MLKQIFGLVVGLSIWLPGSVFGQDVKPPVTNEAKDQNSQVLEPAAEPDALAENAAGSTGHSSRKAAPVAATASQPKRILGIIPNYRSVTADVDLAPLSPKAKFGLATQDTFDYGSFLLVGFLAGIGQDRHTVPDFGQGAAGYGQYYAHFFGDQVVGNYFTEAIVPSLTHEDPRYYTMGHGGVLQRTGYALSRLVITKTDSMHRTFNFSEILGNGMAAGVSDLYYPASERTWIKTRQKWTTQIALDGAFNVLKEFWPDISSHLSRAH